MADGGQAALCCKTHVFFSGDCAGAEVGKTVLPAALGADVESVVAGGMRW